MIASQDRLVVAKHIRAEMAKQGLTQAKLAERSAYDERTIRNILKGLPVRDTTLFEICASLRIDLSEMPLRKSFGRVELQQPLKMESGSVAVLPFLNLSADDKQDYFVDGVVEDIITELSRFSELVVIARNSTFQFKNRAVDVRQVAHDLGAQYVVEGSVRRTKNRVRITAQLIDGNSGAHHWAERYDRQLKDVFAVQDDVAKAIASVLITHVQRAEAVRTMNKPPETWEAYDCYLRAAELFSSFPSSTDVEEIYESRRMLERTLSLDPSYARAYALLAATYLATWINPLDEDRLNPAALDRAHDFAQKAVQLDANLPQARGELGHVLLFKGQHDLAIAEFERAQALNPNFIHWRHSLALTYAGQPLPALDVIKSHMLRDPFYPVYASVYLGLAHLVAKSYAEAVPPLREAINRAPDFRPAHLILAATYGRLGRVEDAREEAKHVLRLDPNWTISGTPVWLAPFKHKDDFEHFVGSLRAAGLPE